MKWHPFLNAAAAIAYIGGVVLCIHGIGSLRHDTPDTLLDGVGALSLFVLSAAVMAFLFFYQPLLKLIEHKHAEGASYFLKTLAAFGVMTAIVLALVCVR